MTMKRLDLLIHHFTNTNPWWFIGLGAAVRLVFVIAFCLTTRWINYAPLIGPSSMETGVDGYIQIARTLLTSGEYALEPGSAPVPFRPPVQPVLMAAFGAWSPVYWYIVWLAFAVTLGTATLWLLWKCARLVDLPPAMTRLLILAVAVHPYLVFATRVPGIPPAMIFMTTLLLFGVLSFARSKGKHPVITGVLWGAAALTHGCFLPLFFPTLVFLTMTLRGPWRERLKKSSLMAMATILMIAPWTLRNRITFNQWIPVATGGGLQYWIADYTYFGNRDEGGVFKHIASEFENRHGRKLQIVHGGILNLADDAELVHEAKAQIFAQPSILARRALIGSLLFWTTMDGGLRKAMIISIMSLPLILLGLGLGVAVIAKKAWSVDFGLAALLLLEFWGLFALVQAVGPYFLAITPCLMFLIALSLDLLNRQRTRSSGLLDSAKLSTL
jgi:hypothetical protein